MASAAAIPPAQIFNADALRQYMTDMMTSLFADGGPDTAGVKDQLQNIYEYLVELKTRYPTMKYDIDNYLTQIKTTMKRLEFKIAEPMKDPFAKTTGTGFARAGRAIVSGIGSMFSRRPPAHGSSGPGSSASGSSASGSSASGSSASGSPAPGSHLNDDILPPEREGAAEGAAAGAGEAAGAGAGARVEPPQAGGFRKTRKNQKRKNRRRRATQHA